MATTRRTLIGLILGALTFGAAAGQTPRGALAVTHQLFLFLYRPGPAWVAGRPMRQQDLRAHAAYHDALVRDGRGFAGGGYAGMDGGLAIVRAANLEEAQAMLAVDPAIVNGVFTAEIRQWVPRFYTQAPLVPPVR